MLLVADVGNTRVHLGLFEGDALVARQAFPGDAVASLDAQWDALTEGLGAVVPEGAILCSVNPKAKIPFAHWAFTRFGTRPLVVGETVPYPMPVRLDDPREVGPDRVVNAYAAWRRCGSGPIVVCDFGTAITLDVVSEDGAYVGGVIAPGVRTAARALADRTALLPTSTCDRSTTSSGATRSTRCAAVCSSGSSASSMRCARACSRSSAARRTWWRPAAMPSSCAATCATRRTSCPTSPSKA